MVSEATNSKPKDGTPQRSPSVNALKLLGKKILHASSHVENVPSGVIENSRLHSGNSISPLRHRKTSPSQGTVPSSLAVNRNRSPSLTHSKNNTLSNGGSTSHPLHAIKSNSSIANLLAHANNPFVAESSQKQRGGIAVAPTSKLNKDKNSERKIKTHHMEPHRSKSFVNNKILNTEDFRKNDERSHLVYNPYGINNSRPGTAFAEENRNDGDNDLSFYLHDGNVKIRMLPLPIQNPNDFLPERMTQFSIHLTDNFVFDSNNKTIGSGGSSEVRIVRSAYRQNRVYALKKLNMIYDETPDKFYKRCSKEFIIAKHLSHNVHIISTYLLVKIATTTYTTRGWGFIMELGHKDLFQLIERSGWRQVPLSEKYCIFKQIAQGVKYCHDNGIAHRDLKPENVLITKDGICKLTDFGISDWYHVEPDNFESPVKTCQGMIGSPPFTPPEVMYFDAKNHYDEKLQKPYNPLAMDYYALGILLFTLINNIIPFIESCNHDPRFRDFEAAYEKFVKYSSKNFRVKNSYKPGPGSEYSLSKNFKSDLNATRVAWRLADPNPETRYTIEELFNDPWFQKIETCVDPDDESCIMPPPDVRKASVLNSSNGEIEYKMNDANTYNMDNESETNSDVLSNHLSIGSDNAQYTKPRSMVEIAEAPLKLPEQLQSKRENKASFTLNEDTSKHTLDSLSVHDDYSDASESSGGSKRQSLASSSSSSNGKNQEESVDAILEHSTPPTADQSRNETGLPEPYAVQPHLPTALLNSKKSASNNVTERMTDLSLAAKKTSGSSMITTGGHTPRSSPLRKRTVVHHHLEVPSSVVHMPSSQPFIVSR
ncbi:hypothetical protein KAFR_0D04500 [Kazachstania africana CBS 2517]|uniref:non-specific serine/threonine protein kinase n=1 Tax=Kazachstania africana (strain ATCC 22294 / BCRC 22015 / CBS 2517 / CECT 1963 / NBRC 1671 / NRRL Y-8276) TaxID=1071382 RepID=H2AUP8_KAZAF|nr:hypothetical protein KAFR_0D04500 [Kazachstania africana CBS 2517]CCF58098.1 hypothetical protein KAFR_0D04500 [Kazachstania africana CBS 2517]